MALLLSCDSLSKSYGSRGLFHGISLGISDGERLGLIGPNGAGKSTLLKIFAGLEKPDAGTVSVRRNTRVVYLPQDDAFPDGATVNDVLVAALRDQPLDEIERDVEIGGMLALAGFEDKDQDAGALSGGWRKRLALARDLLRKPDVLLLDEPTNHLDIEGILWLEKLLQRAAFAFVIISHDRIFLENTSNRTIEMNAAYPQGYLGFDGNYSAFLVKKDQFLAAQQTLEAALATKMAREIEWLRRGPQARTTKAQYRIDEAGRMQEELRDVRARNAMGVTAGIDFAATGRRTQRLLVAHEIDKSLGGRPLFSGLSFVLSPGTRLGLIGPNGSGKTSLIRILAGTLPPDSGAVKPADRLRVVVFDQNRQQLDLRQSLRQALAGENDTVTFNGQSIHVTSWAKRFLFRTETLEVPIAMLSGGEQARILIARLMLQPADLLILDEPTNDLDISSLDVLEESLAEYPGAMVLVTHDRYLLDHIATELLALDGRGNARFFADYYQWEQANSLLGTYPSIPSLKGRGGGPHPKTSATTPAGPRKPRPADNVAVRISRAELRELERMEDTITQAEAMHEALQKQLNDPDVISDYRRLDGAAAQIEEAGQKVAALYARWEELEAKKAMV
jgi:ATP-binding cassette subfamily F protein uup